MMTIMRMRSAILTIAYFMNYLDFLRRLFFGKLLAIGSVWFTAEQSGAPSSQNSWIRVAPYIPIELSI